MLSFKMAEVLVNVPYLDLTSTHKDGRTVHALRTKGYATKVEWNAGMETYTFKLTKAGSRISRHLRFIPTATLKEILS